MGKNEPTIYFDIHDLKQVLRVFRPHGVASPRLGGAPTPVVQNTHQAAFEGSSWIDRNPKVLACFGMEALQHP